ncbi:MAG: MBL fold metallo-hydrolase [Acidobacteriota bacterium]
MSHAHHRRPPGLSRRGFLQTGAGLAAWEAVAHGQQGSPSPAGESTMLPGGKPVRLSEHLYAFKDTCNVYLVQNGAEALLIDFGSGRLLDLAPSLGISKIAWILHTHHHREQAQGDGKAVAERIPIAVPAHERHLFEEAENFWRNRRINHLYSVRNDFKTLTRNVPAAAVLQDYETFRWGPYEFFVLPTPGHTVGSITLVGKIDGKTVAFSGDLIFAPGKVQTLHDLQYNYGGMEGVDFSVYSLTRLAERNPDLVCPSHGEPISNPIPGINDLIRKLSDWYDYWRGPTMIVRNRPIAISPHLVAHHLPVSSFYAVISDSGKAMFLDYGAASNTTFRVFNDWADVHDRMRFLEHSIDTLKSQYGLKSIDLVMPSHMHDDHINGIPHLIRHYGTKVWCYENMKDILENPRGRNLGCILPEAIKVERTFRDRESFRWEEFEFTVAHSPGHTEYQMALFATIDGARVAFTGDAFFNTPANPEDGLRHNLIYRNDVYSESHMKSLRNIFDFQPNVIAPGHGSPFLLNRTDLARFENRLKQQKSHFEGLIADPDVDFGLDPSWAHLYPYQLLLKPGETRPVELRIRNHRSRPMVIDCALALPDGWRSQPARARVSVPARTMGKSVFQVSIPAGWVAPLPRVAIAADIMADAEYLGQIAEAVVDVGE